jgi:methylated-DNA-protein-cysteine methyltransferase related protein
VTPWEESIDRVLRSLGPGDVVTYGEVALEAGRPGAARSVGTFLAGSGLVPGHEAEQARRLRKEGVAVDEARGRVKLSNRR